MIFSDEELNLNEKQKFKGKIIYLDQNIYGRLIDGRMPHAELAKELLISLSKTKDIFIPFSFSHIYEVHNIPKENTEYRKKHLDLIKIISNSYCFNYRYDIQRYSLRPECPFRMFDSIVESENIYDTLLEIPKIFEQPEYVEELKDRGIDKKVFENFNPTNLSFMKDFNIRNLYKSGVDQGQVVHLREILNLNSKELNNLNISEAIKLIDNKLLNLHNKMLEDSDYINAYQVSFGHLNFMSIAEQIEFVSEKICTLNNLESNEFTKMLMLAEILEMYGYQAQGLTKDRASAFFDHIHFVFACQADAFVSRDNKLIKKIGSKAIHSDDFFHKIINGITSFAQEDGTTLYQSKFSL